MHHLRVRAGASGGGDEGVAKRNTSEADGGVDDARSSSSPLEYSPKEASRAQREHSPSKV